SRSRRSLPVGLQKSRLGSHPGRIAGKGILPLRTHHYRRRQEKGGCELQAVEQDFGGHFHGVRSLRVSFNIRLKIALRSRCASPRPSHFRARFPASWVASLRRLSSRFGPASECTKVPRLPAVRIMPSLSSI